MTLIRADGLGVGFLSAVKETSFVVTGPQTPFDFLVVVTDHGKTAIALGNKGGFRGFECSDNTAYGGLFIPSPCFDLDLGRLGDPYEPVPGNLVRHGDVLSIIMKAERFAGLPGGMTEIACGLPKSEGVRAVFNAWEISIGSGIDRKVLFQWGRDSTNGVD